MGPTDHLKTERYREVPFDKNLTFDKVTDVYHAGVAHDEDQPVHLHVLDTEICATRCAEEYGNPCQRFCPAAVYEMEDNSATGRKELKINFSNCVHCKTCDIMDPYQIINWVTPEGGGGPNYKGM
jgi:electron-transferring-flavoprotein dehydrogenase